jgi:uncharacterized membrane protein YdjX (TVP38/TMEM64 family)
MPSFITQSLRLQSLRVAAKNKIMFDRSLFHRLSSKFKRVCRFLSIVVAVAIAIVVFKDCHFCQELLRNSLTWIDSLGSTGKPLAFIIIYNLATVLFIPGSILTLGGGAIFGIVWGSIYITFAAILGAIFAFFIGRYLSRSWILKKIDNHPKFQAIERAVCQQGLKIVFLSRLCPLFPFNLLNYAFGVMQVSWKDYILGSLGIVPGTIMYVYLGSLAGDLTAIGTESMYSNPQIVAANWAIRIVSGLAALGVTIYITRLARQSLNEL